MRITNRTLLIVVLIGMTFDLVISLSVAAVAISAQRSASSAHLARVAVYEACQVDNRSRADFGALWFAVLGLLPPTTPQGRAFDTAADRLIGKATTAHTCTAP